MMQIQVPSQVLPHLQHGVAGSQDLNKGVLTTHFPVPVKAGSISKYSATPGSPGSSEMRCLLSKHENGRKMRVRENKEGGEGGWEYL